MKGFLPKNKRLIFGAVLIFIFLTVALFGSFLAPYDVHYSEKVISVKSESGTTWVFAPVPPDQKHWFGTNEWGYDILTLILYGSKYTFFTAIGVAFFRIFFGGLIGLFLGVKKNGQLGTFNLSVLNGIPTFLIVWLIMSTINTNSPLPSWKLVLIQGLILVVIGIPGIVTVVQNKTIEIKKAQFVLAARSVGASELRIALKHIIPMLKESVIILMFNEIIVVLSLIGQLGIFNLFLGGTIQDPGHPPLYHSKTHEWAGLIGQAKGHLRVDSWILLYPLGIYMLMLIGFYSLSRGLEIHFQKNYSKAPHL